MVVIDVIIETPKGSAEKYSFDPQTNFFKLVKLLPMGMFFPYDFGFIPNTTGEDGDPLDILVISEFKSFPGCMISCKIIGAIKAAQTGKKGKIRNDRFIGIPVQSRLFESIKDVEDLPGKLMREIQDFFYDYNKREGKVFEVLAILKSSSAIKIIAANKKFNSGT